MKIDIATSFLGSLPAVLGIVGFVIYNILKRSAAEDPVIKAIIEKLSYQEPKLIEQLKELSRVQREKLLKSDYALREKLSVRDREILDRLLSHQYKLNWFVYGLCGLLLIFGLILYLRPQPHHIDGITIQNAGTNDVDMIVDIDPITVTWTSSGSDGEIFVVLVNSATGQQSQRIRAMASDGKLKIDPDPYWNFDKILSDRMPNENNRIRVIIYTRERAFQSIDFEIKVGVKIICYPRLPNILVFNAIVDQRIVDNFQFAPRLELFTEDAFHNGKLFEAPEYGPEPAIKINDPSQFSPVDFVFTVNPSDMVADGIFRTDVNSLRASILTLKSGKDNSIFPLSGGNKNKK